jgi:hypothetical protein
MSALEFANPNRWQLLKSGLIKAEPHPSYPWKMLSIESVAVVPFLIESPAVAILVTTSKQKPTWKRAGYLQQRVATGIMVGGGQDADFGDNFRVLLDRLTVVEFPVVSSYEVRFTPVSWLVDISFSCWQYVPAEP